MRTDPKPELDDKDRGLLWHYTGFRSFDAIMKSKTIWLSETTYLNDREEMVHGVAMAREVIAKRAQEAGRRADDYAGKGNTLELEHVVGALGAFTSDLFDTFVASFSKRGDLLSQWRAYCPTGGVAIGFDPNSLGYCLSRLGLPLEGGRRRVQAMLADCLYRRFMTTNDYKIDEHEPVAQFANIYAAQHKMGYPQHIKGDILRFAARFKHPGFEEESEVRAIYTRKWDGPDKAIQVRSENDRLVRYVEAGWKGAAAGEKEETCALRAVRLGPTPPDERAAMMDAIERLLIWAGLPDICVDQSDTPLRRP